MKRLHGTLLLLALSHSLPGTAAEGLSVQPFGATGSKQKVERVLLENADGMRVSYIDFGATLTSIEVPDRNGVRQNVVLSLPDLAAFERTMRKYGAVIGRYAGRIAGARFSLDGQEFHLPARKNGNAIHGEPDGFDKRVWRRRDFQQPDSLGSSYTLVSEDGDQGMPGRLEVTVTYRLSRRHPEFSIEYQARSSAPTVVNLTNHAFFNLAGAGTNGLDTHVFRIGADRYAVTDSRRIPTGMLATVEGTPFDLRSPQRLATAYDDSLLFANWLGKLAEVASICESTSGRCVHISTTEPSVQFYTGNGFDGSEVGSEGVAYQAHDGFAFETQHLPDSPHQPHFPTTTLRPGTTFRSVTSFHFEAEK